jgi:hypothetical protein
MFYFQIEILVEGLKEIVSHNAGLCEKDKAKFFGMISVFRGEKIP